MSRYCLNNRPGAEVPARCEKVVFQDGPMCRACGCHVCGGIILADTEDWPHPLCPEHYEELETSFAKPMATRACWALLQAKDLAFTMVGDLDPYIETAVRIATVSHDNDHAIELAQK